MKTPKRFATHLKETARLGHEHGGHNGCVNTLFWTQNSTLISSSDDKTIKIWQPGTPHPLKGSFDSGHISNVFSAKSLDSERIVSCAADGQVRLHDISDVALEDGFVRAFHSRTHRPHLPFKCHGEAIAFEVEVITDPFVWYSCASDGTVNRYDSRVATSCNCGGCTRFTIIDINCGAGKDAKVEHALQVPEQHTSPQLESPLARSFVMRQFFRTTDWNPEFGISCISVDPGNPNHLATASDDDYIRIWDLRFVPSHWTNAVTKSSPKSRGQVYHYTPFSQTRRHKITSARFDPSGSGDLAVSYAKNHVRLIRPSFESLENDTVQTYIGARNEKTMIKECAFYPRPNPEWILAGSDDGKVFCWNKETGLVETILEGDSRISNCLAPHPTLPMLAVSGIDHDIKIFEPLAEEEFDDSVLARILERNAYPDRGPMDEVDDLDLDIRVEDEEGHVVQMPNHLLLHLLAAIANEGLDSDSDSPSQ
jgi:WD40 repeat protein